MPKVPFWVFILLTVLYCSAIRIDTMDVDASQYAEISREMAISGDYLHVYDRGMDYLDKPPFLFWVSAISMKAFGVNNFGYKLPSILFALWALYGLHIVFSWLELMRITQFQNCIVPLDFSNWFQMGRRTLNH